MNLKAHLIDYGILMSKENKPLIWIKFLCEDEKTRSWFGSLNEGKAREITMDALLRCGLKGNDLEALAMGTSSNLLDIRKELDLTINEETYNNKTREKIQWINEIGGQNFKNAMAKEDAVKLFQGMNLKGDLAARRAMRPKEPDDVF